MPKEAFNKIIKLEYLNEFKECYDEATPEELKGLDLMEKIYATKGRAKVGGENSRQHYKNKSLNKNIDLKQAEENFRMRQITTSYQWTFGIAKNEKPKQTILKYKTLSELNLGELLTDSAKSFIDNWLSMGDDVTCEECILSTLRALHAKLVTKEPNNTEMKTKYVWKTDWNLSQPIRMDKAGSTLFGFKPNLKALEKQEMRETKLRKKMEELQNSDLVKQLTIYKDFKIN